MLHRWVSIRNRGDAYRKQGSQRQKAHKNPDFVLETPKNGGSKCKKRTKMGLLCAFLFREAAQCGPRCLRLALGTAQLWSNHLRPVLRLASGLVANEPTVCEADRLRSRLPAGPTAWGGRLPAEPTACEPTACGANRLWSRLPAGPTTCEASRLRG